MKEVAMNKNDFDVITARYKQPKGILLEEISLFIYNHEDFMERYSYAENMAEEILEIVKKHLYSKKTTPSSTQD